MRKRENYNKYMREYMLVRYHKRRATAISSLGGQCSCGSTDDLHFHHTDPDMKEFTIARGSSVSKKRWDSEIAKCILLCGDCHRAEHAS